MKLYRGDKIFNTTEPGRYRWDGIRSKSFGKGSPTYIEPEGLLDNIRRHINPVSQKDWDIYNKTEFISFSRSLDRALFWLAEQNTIKISKTEVAYEETRYLFTLNIADIELQAIDPEKTMYLYIFACNPNLKEPNSNSWIEEAISRSTESDTSYKTCPICNRIDKRHALVLIDSVKYLQTYKSSESMEGAVINAQRDEEWLVLPTDDISGFSGTTIPRADFWSAEFFNADGEHRPSGMHEILGIAHDEHGNVI